MSEYDLLGELNRAAGTTGLGFSAACNALAGTTGLEGVGALNVLAGTTGKDLDGVLAYLAGRPGLGANAAARLIGVNLLTANQASVETDATGFGVWGNCMIARSTSQALSGVASLAATSLATGDMAYLAGPSSTVIPGARYTAHVSGRAATTGRAMRVYIRWIDAGLAQVGLSTMLDGATSTSSGWTSVTKTDTAPAGSVYAQVLFYSMGCAAASEVHYGDTFGIWLGSRTTWVAP